MKEKKAFLFKNLTVETRFEVLRFSAAVLISLALTLIIILLVSREPARALSSLFLGPLSSPRRFANVIELAVTLTFAGLAVSVMFSANQFNMGAEGGFYASAAVAAMAAITLPLPPVLLPLAAIIAGMAAGALVCVTPAFLKGKWGASELVSSLMLNYAFFYIAKYCVFTNFRDPAAGQLATFPIPAAAKLANIVPGTRINMGILIVIAAVIVTAIFVRRTVWGYALVQTGRSPKFAAYSGINTQAVLYYSQIIGGALAGMGGAVEVLGLYERFTWQTLPGYGFDGIIVSILAKNKPQFVPLAAFLLAYLRIGADRMSTGSDVTSEMISIIQGIIIMLVAAQAFMARRRQKMLLKEASGA